MVQSALMNTIHRGRGVGLHELMIVCFGSANAGRKLATFRSYIGWHQSQRICEPQRQPYLYGCDSTRYCFCSKSTPPQPPPRIPSARIRFQQQHQAKVRRTSCSSDVNGRALSLVYVHPLSQIVLLHFQTYHHEWIQRLHLDQRLFIHRDGTFLIESNHSHYESVVRLWTYYNTEERTHWLGMSTQHAMHRVLLQDNSMIGWNGYQSKVDGLTERVRNCIQEVMDLIDEN